MEVQKIKKKVIQRLFLEDSVIRRMAGGDSAKLSWGHFVTGLFGILRILDLIWKHQIAFEDFWTEE